MSMSEYTPRRLKSAIIKANQLKETGAAAVVTSCHNCVDGLTDLIRHYELGMEVTQLVTLVANAIVVEERVAVPVPEEVLVEEVPVEEIPVPVEEIPVPVEEVPAPVVAEPVAAEAKALPLADRVLLVADDEPDQVEFLAAVFEDNGATVHRAMSGDETLAMARELKPDLLTLDLSMPGRDVGEVFELLRKDPELEDLKICVITGRPELRKLIYDRTARKPEGYMDKPIDEDELLVNVRRILKMKHEED
jgi:CheY-like chemotaxis protein